MKKYTSWLPNLNLIEIHFIGTIHLIIILKMEKNIKTGFEKILPYIYNKGKSGRELGLESRKLTRKMIKTKKMDSAKILQNLGVAK